jgi:hypothetical protein
MHVIVLKEDIDYTLNHIKSNLNYTLSQYAIDIRHAMQIFNRFTTGGDSIEYQIPRSASLWRKRMKIINMAIEETNYCF